MIFASKVSPIWRPFSEPRGHFFLLWLTQVPKLEEFKASQFEIRFCIAFLSDLDHPRLVKVWIPYERGIKKSSCVDHRFLLFLSPVLDAFSLPEWPRSGCDRDLGGQRHRNGGPKCRYIFCLIFGGLRANPHAVPRSPAQSRAG